MLKRVIFLTDRQTEPGKTLEFFCVSSNDAEAGDLKSPARFDKCGGPTAARYAIPEGGWDHLRSRFSYVGRPPTKRWLQQGYSSGSIGCIYFNLHWSQITLPAYGLGTGVRRGRGVGRVLGVGVGLGEAVGVGVADGLIVAVAVAPGVAVEVAVAVAVAVVLGVTVAVAMGVAVAVSVAVGVALDAGVVVAVAVGVGVPPVCISNEPVSIRLFTTRLNPGPR